MVVLVATDGIAIYHMFLEQKYNKGEHSVFIRLIQHTVQPARNLHKPSDPGGQNYPRAVEHRSRTPVEPGGHDPRVSR